MCFVFSPAVICEPPHTPFMDAASHSELSKASTASSQLTANAVKWTTVVGCRRHLGGVPAQHFPGVSVTFLLRMALETNNVK